MAKFVIEYNPIGLTIVTRPDKPGKAVYLRSKSVQKIVVEVLKQDERERLYARERIEVNDDEPRATTIAKLWATWATDTIGSEGGLEGEKGKGGCGKRFAEIGVGLLVMAIFIAIFVDLGNAAVFLSMAWCPLVWIPAWPVGWVVLAIIGQVRSSREQRQRSQTS